MVAVGGLRQWWLGVDVAEGNKLRRCLRCATSHAPRQVNKRHQGGGRALKHGTLITLMREGLPTSNRCISVYHCTRFTTWLNPRNRFPRAAARAVLAPCYGVSTAA